MNEIGKCLQAVQRDLWGLVDEIRNPEFDPLFVLRTIQTQCEIHIREVTEAKYGKRSAQQIDAIVAAAMPGGGCNESP